MSSDGRTEPPSTAAEENPSTGSWQRPATASGQRPSTGSRPRGLLFIVSAPSGAGKTTLVEKLVEETPGLKMSRSYTSRPARPGECDGVDYNFVSREHFESMVQAGEFLEWASLYGHLYGTCAADTGRLLADGHDVVLVIDVQGARKVRDAGVQTSTVFVMPPSF